MSFALKFSCSFGLLFQRVTPLISSGMMKKLEPVLQFEKRRTHCHPLGTIKPLNAPRVAIQSKKQKGPDEFCFPSSPSETGKEEATTSKGERKKEIKLTKKAAMKTKKVLKVGWLFKTVKVFKTEAELHFKTNNFVVPQRPVWVPSASVSM